MADAWMTQADKQRAAKALADAKPAPQLVDKDEPKHPVMKTGGGLTQG